MPAFKNLRSFATLKAIMARLRSPKGCPWDRQQTHTSLKANLLEECYEALETIDQQNPQKLCEELGDILMQVVFHAQIASEANEFNIEDVIQSINAKLVHRHPHVFGKLKVNNTKEVMVNWEALKQEERQVRESLLSGIPKEMPSLSYSQSIQRRAAGVGFDWEKIEEIVGKFREEVDELKQAPNQEEINKEFGDLLFTLASIARRLNVDLETALRSANQRFFERFSYIEEICRQRGVDVGSLSLDEQNTLWEEAKQKVK